MTDHRIPSPLRALKDRKCRQIWKIPAKPNQGQIWCGSISRIAWNAQGCSGLGTRGNGVPKAFSL